MNLWYSYSMKKAIWIITTCPTQKEASKIGYALLRQRSIACYDCVPRLASGFFWPPKTGKIETSKGVILFLTTLPQYVPAVYQTVKKLHSDHVPFLAAMKLDNVPDDYYRWLRRELRFVKNAKARSSNPRSKKNAQLRRRLIRNTG